MQRGVKLLSVSLTLLFSVPGSARLCFSVLTQKPLCTPITLHRLTTSTKMSLMKSLGDNSSRCRLSASIHLRAPSPLWFLSSSVALGGIWDSAVAVYFSKKKRSELCWPNSSQLLCDLHLLSSLTLAQTYVVAVWFICRQMLFHLCARPLHLILHSSSPSSSWLSLLVYLIKYCDSVLCSDVDSMANYFFYDL